MRGAGRLEADVRINGRVQGVGFRPFIYRTAIRNELVGYVVNLGDAGVEVIVEGTRGQIEAFVRDVREQAPAVSEIKDIHVLYRPYEARFDDFKIERSQNRGKTASGIFPPDIGICDDCRKDIEDEKSRWYDYPFTACAWCGPRFTAIKRLPYDRERTHMGPFPVCEHCDHEYHDPMNRRFDAQGITCPKCGPRMSLYDSSGSDIHVDDVFREAADLLRDGKIVAVKGIGGVHLAALATDDAVVIELRRRKRRPAQPFALMSPGLESIESFAEVDEYEASLLTSWRKPIVLLKKKSSNTLSEMIAPGLDHVGVMLPYTGIHVLLFKHFRMPALIMTSGNRPGLPMAISNDAAFEDLKGIADYFLLHDRDIVARCDDSVLRAIQGRTAFIRRSRGFMPDPIDVPIKGFSIALGSELRNSAAITYDGRCFLTQYLGDTNNLESLEFEKDAIDHLKGILNITRNPDVIGCDMHPAYMTSHLALELSQGMGVELIKSQHHHAHIASVAAENGVSNDEPVLGIALDGAGYGTDGAIWGGEVIISNYSGFERAGHLEYIPLPGGDLCALYPLRMLLASLTNQISDMEIRDITKNHIEKGAIPRGKRELDLILKMARDGRTTKTSSAGRFLDAIAALLGICYQRTYEGEPAMKLESFASIGNDKKIDIKPDIDVKEGIFVLKTRNLIYNLTDMCKNSNISDIAAFGQRYLAEGMSEIAIRLASEHGVKNAALSGGVFVNEYITSKITKCLCENNIKVLNHVLCPPGDGGIALGQSMISLSSVI